MRLLFWYCDRFACHPAMKTLEHAPDAAPMTHEQTVVAFIHVEPPDVEDGSSAETKLVKNAKWLARKWETRSIVLHSFTHLGEEKADPEAAKELIDRVQKRLETAGYTAVQTPYGYFNDLSMDAPGHPLARIYKEF
ncbi:MAG: threonyl-tRNA synthetase editing domain-containing protein [Deltaproteobacteria bacterium]|nr:threonyl-tRNA synthetase editing domain-containing protein [Deltaproteobacteria bacterium]